MPIIIMNQPNIHILTNGKKNTFYTLQKKPKGLQKLKKGTRRKAEKHEEKKAEQERINNELKSIVLCTNSTDDFTGLKTIETNPKEG